MVRRLKKINPNEYGSLKYDQNTLAKVSAVLFRKKIFRYSNKKESYVDQFEEAVKKMLGVKYALGVNNGTSALKTALRVVEIRPGDRVLISAYTFIATAASVISFGGTPVPIDFDFITGMDLTDLQREVKKGCSAIIPVHLQGYTFDISPIMTLAKNKKIPVIEDACQAFGSRYKGVYAGCFADIGTFSFQQYKQISCGEGGLIVTNNEQYYKKAKIYSDHGMVRELMSWDSDNAIIGDNYRINNLQAAILISQTSKLNKMVSIQKRNKKYVLNHIIPTKTSCVVKSLDEQGETGMNILFLTKSKEIADAIISHAKIKKIEFRRLWDRPYYKYRVFERIKLTPYHLKKPICYKAEDIAQRLLALSLSPILKKDALMKIAQEIRKLQEEKLIS